MVAISSELDGSLLLVTGLPQAEQKRTLAASSVPQKEQYAMAGEFPVQDN